MKKYSSLKKNRLKLKNKALNPPMTPKRLPAPKNSYPIAKYSSNKPIVNAEDTNEMYQSLTNQDPLQKNQVKGVKNYSSVSKNPPVNAKSSLRVMKRNNSKKRINSDRYQSPRAIKYGEYMK